MRLWVQAFWVICILFLRSHFACALCSAIRKDSLPMQKQNRKLRLLKRNWPSHAIITHIAEHVLREELRYDVEVVSEDEFPDLTSTLDDFEFIAKERFDANLEVWMTSEKSTLYARWVDADDAVSAGSHKLLSHSGMYVPWYDGDAVQSQGQFSTAFRKPEELQKYTNAPIEGEAAGDSSLVCNKLEWSCSNFTWFPSSCKDQGRSACGVQLLRGTSDWYQGLVEQRIEANGLNISAVYTSWSTLNTEAWKAYANKERFLFINWEPNTPISGVQSNFQRVQFPPYWSNGCEKAGTTPVGGTSCDDPPAPLLKIVSPTLAEYDDAFYFASRLSLTQDDYDAMFAEYSLAGEYLENASEVACNWLVRMGSERYGKWIQYTNKVELEVNFEGCWNYVWVQLGLLVLSFFIQCVYANINRWRARRELILMPQESEGVEAHTSGHWKEIEEEESLSPVTHKREESSMRPWDGIHEESAQLSAQVLSSASRVAQEKLDSASKVAQEKLESASRVAQEKLDVGANVKSFRKIMKSSELGFFIMRRDEKAFIGSEAVFHIPERGQSTFRVNFDSGAQIQLFAYLVSSSMKGSIFRAVQYALAVGALGSVVHIINDNAVQNRESDPWTHEFGDNMSRIISDFIYLPALLIVFKLIAQITHWSTSLNYGGCICGRMGDLCLIIGSIIGSNDASVCERERVRKLQFKFYRYLNAIHLVAYHGLDERLQRRPSEICENLCRAGLLTDGEAAHLVGASQTGLYGVLLSWVAALWHTEVEESQDAGAKHSHGQNFMDKLMALRTHIACLRDALDYEREPEVANSMTYAVTYALFLIVALGYPASFYTAVDSGTCLQPWSILSASVLFLTYDGMMSMIRILARSPFDRRGDCVNIDAQLCGMEEATFFMIRSSYTKAEGEKADQAADEIPGIADAKIDGDKTVEDDETL